MVVGNLGLFCGPGLPAIGPVILNCKLDLTTSDDLLPLTSAQTDVGAAIKAAEGAVQAVQVPHPDTPAVRLATRTRGDGGQGARGGAARGEGGGGG